jgi:hypothetical protein
MHFLHWHFLLCVWDLRSNLDGKYFIQMSALGGVHLQGMCKNAEDICSHAVCWRSMMVMV